MLAYLTLALAALAVVLGVLNLMRPPRVDSAELERHIRGDMTQIVNSAVNNAARRQAEGQRMLAGEVAEQKRTLDERLKAFSMENEQKLENIRVSTRAGILELQASNEKKLDEMRHTVDEKLQKTLEERLRQSFSLVSENLEKVQKGLGEMQTLASGVGDLKKVLSNVKTRGILGEIQLGAILEEILAPEQYATNVATVKGSADRVEYAIRLPGDEDGEPVWLPIDAKFPSDAYADLADAYDRGDTLAVEAAGKVLESRVRQFAKSIHDKYIHVPETTEFAIMFLPVEGLYAEVVRRGLVEKLQRDFRVNIAGPTTMAALLNSLQMGFRTLAIQKRSGEVWKVLGEVKSEFGRFGEVLAKAQGNLKKASRDLDDLIGVRTRQIQRKLRDVATLPANSTQTLESSAEIGFFLEEEEEENTD